MTSTFIVIAAINGFLGVALGAFAAHSLANHFSDKPRLEANFKTGVQYHFYHTLAILGVAFASREFGSSLISLSGWLFLLGIILFSGSLYILSLTGKRWLGAVTPLGGLAFLAGWVCLALGALQG
ncbi:MAG: DUF423 domain-containing protein [Chloroflexi bacterium]|nr:DUF423 domain-containing protein [Chloroflexota bacterium]